jgi:hypothetical protein
MVVGDKKFGVISYVIGGGGGGSVGILPPKIVCFFPPIELKCEYFLKQIFEYIALHCHLIDRI